MRRYSLTTDSLLWQRSDKYLVHNSTNVPTVRKDRLNPRRHSHSMGIVNFNVDSSETADAKQRSRRSTISSDDTTSSFGTLEYSSMIDSWVGDCWGEMEDQLMRLSGNDFKAVALSPNIATVQMDPYQEPTQNYECIASVPLSALSAVSSVESSSHTIEGFESENHFETFRESEGGKSPIRILKRNCDLFREIKGAASPCSRGERNCETSREAKGGGSPSRIARLNSRRLSGICSDSPIPWPSFSGGAPALDQVRAQLYSPTFSALSRSDNDLAVIAVEIYFSMVFYLARSCGSLCTLSPVQQLALYVAALCHDLEHPTPDSGMLQGVSADYLLRSKSALAACYREDPGLLEKHHSLRAFELIISKDINLLQSLCDFQKREVCSLAREVIIATDMRLHSAFLVAASASGEEDTIGPVEERVAQSCACRGSNCRSCRSPLLLMQLLLKCADISNVLKPFDDAAEWAVRITDEFFAQGDLERAGGMEISQLCDRSSQSRVAVQRSFIDCVAGPFLHIVADSHIPAISPLLSQLLMARVKGLVASERPAFK